MVMPYTPTGISAQPPEPRPITQRKFDKGVVSIVSPSNLPLNALVKADNLLLDEDGYPRPRPGVDWYGSAVPGGNVIGTRVNMVTNPTFEAGTTGWLATSGTTISQSSVFARSGSYSLKAFSATGPGAVYAISGMTIGVSYTVFYSIYVTSNCQAFSSISGGDKAAGGGSFTTAGAWVDRSFTFTAGATSRNFTLFTTALTDSMYVDRVAIGPGLDAYFDGGSVPESTDAWTAAWDGTPNLSASTKTLYDDIQHAIVGGDFFVDSEERVHLVIATNDGSIYRSTDDGTTWDRCTGGSFTAGYKVRSEQTNSALYLFNANDEIIRYTGTTSLTVYETLETPVHPSVAKTGLAGTGIITYYYRISAVNDVGYTAGSSIQYTGGAANNIAVDRVRSSWDDTNYITLTWNNGMFDAQGDGDIDLNDASVIAAAYNTGTYNFPKRYDIYIGTAPGEEVYIDSVDVSGTDELATVTYVDKGGAPEQTLLLVPEDNTTAGPKVGDMAQVGTRLYATQDKDNPWRVWISAAGRDIGKFSTAFEGTYIDLQKGSQYRPVKVEDYRDGKGTPLATVWRRSVDGRGDIWQGTLDTFTVGDISFPVPNFYKLPGSRGTNAPDSVVNVLNDYMYYNSQAFFNLGSRAQFLNLLSTDESSANIRNDVRNIEPTASSGIAAFFSEAKVYFSVPYQSTTNNRIIVYDTERRAWLPQAFDFGVERFFQYTDTGGQQHILCWKPGDVRLSEISSSIKGDYGEPIFTELLTGQVFVNPKNRFDFFWTEEGEFELADVSGTINIELIALTRENGYETVDSLELSPSTTAVGWSTRPWTSHAWTAGSRTVITNYSEPTIKRYFNVQQDINLYQYRITTNDLEADYILRTLQVNGTDTLAGKPREWEMLS